MNLNGDCNQSFFKQQQQNTRIGFGCRLKKRLAPSPARECQEELDSGFQSGLCCWQMHFQNRALYAIFSREEGGAGEHEDWAITLKSSKFYPLIPRKEQEWTCQRMCSSRECYKPESGMIHLEGSSPGESSKLMLKVHCEMNSRGPKHTLFPLFLHRSGLAHPHLLYDFRGQWA